MVAPEDVEETSLGQFLDIYIIFWPGWVHLKGLETITLLPHNFSDGLCVKIHYVDVIYNMYECVYVWPVLTFFNFLYNFIRTNK